MPGQQLENTFTVDRFSCRIARYQSHPLPLQSRVYTGELYGEPVPSPLPGRSTGGTIRDKRINLENKFGKFIMKRIHEIYFSSDKVLSDKSVSPVYRIIIR